MARRNPVPVIGLVESVGLGAADGYLASMDANAGRSNTTDPWLHGWNMRSSWLQIAAVAAGLVGPHVGLKEQYAEPLLLGGTVLSARVAGFAIAQKVSKGSGAVAAHGMTARPANALARMAYVPPEPALRGNHDQRPGNFAYVPPEPALRGNHDQRPGSIA